MKKPAMPSDDENIHLKDDETLSCSLIPLGILTSALVLLLALCGGDLPNSPHGD